METKLARLQEQMEDMMHNKVNIMRLQDDMAEARKNIEKLKDSTRAIKFANGNNNHGDK
jgi:succinate dehydrogenase/fumarate reductase flavoprotein subunit